MTEYRAKQANDIPDAQPATGQYDENEIRVGALQLVVARQRSTIRAQRDEIERLGHCIAALEREHAETPISPPLYAPGEQGHGAWNGTAKTW